MKPHPESLDGTPPPKQYRWWRFIEHSLPIIVIYLMVATLVGFLIAPNVIRHGADRPRRDPVEAVPRRHSARSARPEGRGPARAAAVGQAVPLRPAPADHHRHLQRHLQGRREPRRHDQHPLPAEARRGAATAPDRSDPTTSRGCCARRSATARARSSPNTPPRRSIRPSGRRFRSGSARTPRRCSARA